MGHLKAVCIAAQMKKMNANQKPSQARSSSQNSSAAPQQDETTAALADKTKTANTVSAASRLPLPAYYVLLSQVGPTPDTGATVTLTVCHTEQLFNIM